jgi:hypothetical protein
MRFFASFHYAQNDSMLADCGHFGGWGGGGGVEGTTKMQNYSITCHSDAKRGISSENSLFLPIRNQSINLLKARND